MHHDMHVHAAVLKFSSALSVSSADDDVKCIASGRAGADWFHRRGLGVSLPQGACVRNHRALTEHAIGCSTGRVVSVTRRWYAPNSRSRIQLQVEQDSKTVGRKMNRTTFLLVLVVVTILLLVRVGALALAVVVIVVVAAVIDIAVVLAR